MNSSDDPRAPLHHGQPGWFPDITDSYAERYWDGHRWTARVRDENGEEHHDPFQPALDKKLKPESQQQANQARYTRDVAPRPPKQPPPSPPDELSPGATVLLGALVLGIGTTLLFFVASRVLFTEQVGPNSFLDRASDPMPFGTALGYGVLAAIVGGIILALQGND